jgi:hypothetical protein
MGIVFNQSLNTTDSPTFAGLTSTENVLLNGVTYFRSSVGATRWVIDGNTSLLSQNATGGPYMGSTPAYAFVGDTSTGMDTDGAGTLLLIPNANTVEQRNGIRIS